MPVRGRRCSPPREGPGDSSQSESGPRLLQPACLRPAPHRPPTPRPGCSPPPRSRGAWVPREGLPPNPSAPQSPAPLGSAGSNYPGSICQPRTAGGSPRSSVQPGPVAFLHTSPRPTILPPCWAARGAGSLWAAAAGWGAWIRPSCALGLSAVFFSPPPPCSPVPKPGTEKLVFGGLLEGLLCSDGEGEREFPRQGHPRQAGPAALPGSRLTLWVTAFPGAWAGPTGFVVSGQALSGSHLLGEKNDTCAP